jgi:peptidoglycan hydrolase CwlO-like protein
MNAVAEEVHKHRSTDGVNATKILLSMIAFLIMSFMGTIAYVYTTHTTKTDHTLTAFSQGMTDLVSEIRHIREQGILAYSHAKNNDAKISRLEKDASDFRKETRAYWVTR